MEQEITEETEKTFSVISSHILLRVDFYLEKSNRETGIIPLGTDVEIERYEVSSHAIAADPFSGKRKTGIVPVSTNEAPNPLAHFERKGEGLQKRRIASASLLTRRDE